MSKLELDSLGFFIRLRFNQGMRPDIAADASVLKGLLFAFMFHRIFRLIPMTYNSCFLRKLSKISHGNMIGNRF